MTTANPDAIPMQPVPQTADWLTVLLFAAMSSLNRGCQRSLKFPPMPHSHVHYASLYSSFVSPILKALCLSVHREKAITACVAGLLGVCSPLAIAWFISLVVIQPVNAAAQWSRPHVGDKGCHVFPAFANSYSTSTIPAVQRVIGVPAPLQHGLPYCVFGCAVHSMLNVDRCALPLKASTRAAFSFAKACAVNIANGSAFASAFPKITCRSPVANILKHCPAAKHATAHVYGLVVSTGRIGASHETFLSTEGNLWIEPAGVQAPVRLALFYALLAQTEIATPDNIEKWVRLAGEQGLGFVFLAAGALVLIAVLASIVYLLYLAVRHAPVVIHDWLKTDIETKQSVAKSADKLTELVGPLCSMMSRTHAGLTHVVKAADAHVSGKPDEFGEDVLAHLENAKDALRSP